MKRYKYGEWDLKEHHFDFDNRIYVDLNGKMITGVLEGFYGFTSDTTDDKNCQYVKNGKRI